MQRRDFLGTAAKAGAAALNWSAIAPLSETSVARGGEKVTMPDFTRGA